MNARRWTALFFALSIAACDSEGTEPVGDPTTGGQTPIPVSTSGTSNVNPTGSPPSSGPGASSSQCDHGSCEDCGVCAREGACAQYLPPCQQNPECDALHGCMIACKDDACVQQCVDDHKAGYEVLFDLLTCLICRECYGACNGASACQ